MVSIEKKISSTKYEIQKLTGKNDFNLWCLKMQFLLVHHGLLEALKGSDKMDVSLSEKEKRTMVEKSQNAIVLSLNDKVLRQVSKEKTATGVWAKLEGLYMTNRWSIVST